MCISPVKVKNSKRDFNSSVDRSVNLVRCNHCAQCKAEKKQTYILRSLAEYKDSAFAFFFTLTYNDDNLPHTTIKGNEVACFDKSHVQKFIKSVREHLRTRYNISARFICTSEYGSLTHRPHYHLIIYLDKPLPVQKLYKYVPTSFIRTKKKEKDLAIINRYWKYGFCYSSKKNNGVVNSDMAIKYVCKYVCSDVDSDFLNSSEDLRNLDEVLLDLNLNWDNLSEREKLINEYKQVYSYSRCKHFVTKSKLFGIGLLSNTNNFRISLKDNKVYYVDGQNITPYKLTSYFTQRQFRLTHHPDSIDFVNNKLKCRFVENARTDKENSLPAGVRLYSGSHENLTYTSGSAVSQQLKYNNIETLFNDNFNNYKRILGIILSSCYREDEYYLLDVSKSVPDIDSSEIDFDLHLRIPVNWFATLREVSDKKLFDYVYYQLFNRGYSTVLHIQKDLKKSLLSRFTLNACLDDILLPIDSPFNARLDYIFYSYNRQLQKIRSRLYGKVYSAQKTYEDYHRCTSFYKTLDYISDLCLKVI